MHEDTQNEVDYSTGFKLLSQVLVLQPFSGLIYTNKVRNKRS